ncbi:RNA pyrophosphohydrolase [Methylobrevis albus]|uniref:RNA pyrophosphohydrolase n=1 Tax=Methylobrevis albus TaxID=2793297 RepID=A0A931I0S0_9HYPH|nr:RNA pyrophosphohydrolase [Methylobrevis albus]MBH0238065.1 RNA pyrophosphohydrolase [Methylobrevis albus]
MPDRTDLPYRPCVGIMLLSRDGRAFVGQRRRQEGSTQPIDPDDAWQMPQGGIDEGEDPLAAAKRELYEETNVSSVSLIAEAPDWYAYDLPPDLVRKSWKGRWRGQTQKWFAFRFEGDESEIDIDRPAGGAHKPEFGAWRWETLDRLPGLIVAFKRPVYEQVVAAFAHLAAPGAGR